MLLFGRLCVQMWRMLHIKKMVLRQTVMCILPQANLNIKEIASYVATTDSSVS